MTEKYVLEVDIDSETGEEHCTVLKTDGTTNMANWIEIFSAMYTHHSILEPLVDELNKIQNNYNNTEKYAIKLWEENEQLKDALNQRTDQCDNYYKENEKLKQDKTNLHRAMSRNRVRYNQFRDKVFCCIDKKIDEFKNGDYGDLPCNAIHMFLDLKQELGDI